MTKTSGDSSPQLAAECRDCDVAESSPGGANSARG